MEASGNSARLGRAGTSLSQRVLVGQLGPNYRLKAWSVWGVYVCEGGTVSEETEMTSDIYVYIYTQKCM